MHNDLDRMIGESSDIQTIIARSLADYDDHGPSADYPEMAGVAILALRMAGYRVTKDSNAT
jgi:hypothetical protein